MGTDSTETTFSDWRAALPTLSTGMVTLREPTTQDLGPILELLLVDDSCRFGVDEPFTSTSTRNLIERAQRERAAGLSFTYLVTLNSKGTIVGLVQVRQLDPVFEGADWECMLAQPVRGTGVFLEVARLVGSFAFGLVGVHRLEARVLLNNGRASGALRKLGAVQEGVLRRSLRRGHEYFDQVLWSVLKDDWGEHWVAVGPRVH